MGLSQQTFESSPLTRKALIFIESYRVSSHMRSIQDLSSEERLEEIRVCKQRFELRYKGKTIQYIKVLHIPDKYSTRCDTYEVTAKVNSVAVKKIIPREYIAVDAVELVSSSSEENQESHSPS